MKQYRRRKPKMAPGGEMLSQFATSKDGMGTIAGVAAPIIGDALDGGGMSGNTIGGGIGAVAGAAATFLGVPPQIGIPLGSALGSGVGGVIDDATAKKKARKQVLATKTNNIIDNMYGADYLMALGGDPIKPQPKQPQLTELQEDLIKETATNAHKVASYIDPRQASKAAAMSKITPIITPLSMIDDINQGKYARATADVVPFLNLGLDVATQLYQGKDWDQTEAGAAINKGFTELYENVIPERLWPALQQAPGVIYDQCKKTFGFALGGDPMQQVEIEGQESISRPNGEFAEYKGASHEQGGIDYTPRTKGEYVFSAILGTAEEAKKINRKYKAQDAITKATKEMELNDLKKVNESRKAQMQQIVGKMAFGGPPEGEEPFDFKALESEIDAMPVISKRKQKQQEGVTVNENSGRPVGKPDPISTTYLDQRLFDPNRFQNSVKDNLYSIYGQDPLETRPRDIANPLPINLNLPFTQKEIDNVENINLQRELKVRDPYQYTLNQMIKSGHDDTPQVRKMAWSRTIQEDIDAQLSLIEDPVERANMEKEFYRQTRNGTYKPTFGNIYASNNLQAPILNNTPQDNIVTPAVTNSISETPREIIKVTPVRNRTFNNQLPKVDPILTQLDFGQTKPADVQGPIVSNLPQRTKRQSIPVVNSDNPPRISNLQMPTQIPTVSTSKTITTPSLPTNPFLQGDMNLYDPLQGPVAGNIANYTPINFPSRTFNIKIPQPKPVVKAPTITKVAPIQFDGELGDTSQKGVDLATALKAAGLLGKGIRAGQKAEIEPLIQNPYADNARQNMRQRLSNKGISQALREQQRAGMLSSENSRSASVRNALNANLQANMNSAISQGLMGIDQANAQIMIQAAQFDNQVGEQNANRRQANYTNNMQNRAVASNIRDAYLTELTRAGTAINEFDYQKAVYDMAKKQLELENKRIEKQYSDIGAGEFLDSLTELEIDPDLKTAYQKLLEEQRKRRKQNNNGN